jgi:two-component sensor histidine kinase
MNIAGTIKLCGMLLILCCSMHAQERTSTIVSGGNPDSLEFIKYRDLANQERKIRNQKLLNFDSLQVLFASRTRSDSLYAEALSDYIKDLTTQWKTKETAPFLRELERLASKSGSVDISQKLDYAKGYVLYRDFRFKEASTHFQSALQKALALNNANKIAMSKLWIGGSIASYGKPDSAVAYIFEAIEFFKKNEKHRELANAYSFLAYGYLRTGNSEGAANNFILMEQACRKANERLHEASALLGQAMVRNNQKRFAETESLLNKADAISRSVNFTEGIARGLLQRGELYSFRNKTDTADMYFDSAEVYVKKLNILPLNISLSGMRMQNKFRAGKLKEGDSLSLVTAKQMAEKLPAELKESLIDHVEATHMFTPEEAGSFKKYMLSGKGIETLPVVNPFTGAHPDFDSLFAMAFSKQLVDLETKYKTRQKEDSLRIQQQKLQISNQQLSNRNVLLISAVFSILLIATIAVLQYTSRKRAEKNKREIEKAKDQIEFLTKEMHHQIKNNMGIISRFVEVTEKDGGGPAAISSLRSRVNAIHSLHTILYENDLSREVNLKHYVDKLIPSLKKLYTMSFKLEYEVSPDVNVPTDIANKIGLILTELCTNSYKYAFDNVSNPEVNFSFEADDDKWKFRYADNGHGLPPQLKDSYGMKLIKGLSSQLNGEYRIYNDPGLHFELLIPNLQTV